MSDRNESSNKITNDQSMMWWSAASVAVDEAKTWASMQVRMRLTEKYEH